jgi:hypothetical protein
MSKYHPAANLLLFQINDDSTSNVLVPDYNEGSQATYGGSYTVLLQKNTVLTLLATSNKFWRATVITTASI